VHAHTGSFKTPKGAFADVESYTVRQQERRTQQARTDVHEQRSALKKRRKHKIRPLVPAVIAVKDEKPPKIVKSESLKRDRKVTPKKSIKSARTKTSKRTAS
jgi:hypothetical protein